MRRQIHTSKIGLLGGRIQTVELNGQLFEVKKHKMNGLGIQPSHYSIGVDTHDTHDTHDGHTSETPAPKQHPSSIPTVDNALTLVETKKVVKKKLSQILKGGALAPLS